MRVVVPLCIMTLVFHSYQLPQSVGKSWFGSFSFTETTNVHWTMAVNTNKQGHKVKDMPVTMQSGNATLCKSNQPIHSHRSNGLHVLHACVERRPSFCQVLPLNAFVMILNIAQAFTTGLFINILRPHNIQPIQRQYDLLLRMSMLADPDWNTLNPVCFLKSPSTTHISQRIM